MERNFNEIEIIRRKKIKDLKSNNIEPYSRDTTCSDNSKTIFQKYSKYSKEELQKLNEEVSAFFRIMVLRGPFLVGKDAHGKIQAYVGKQFSNDVLKLREFLDIGDIVKASGPIMKTNTGETTIRAEKLQLITKSLKPLPEKFHGLKDIEERYRRRYLDLIVNNDVRETFWTRSKIISSIRRFFDNLGYMEADTPVLNSILGGAAAKPFKTHHNALDMTFYLRVATELPLKRLLVGGIEKVYEIGRLFRNEGIDTTHNPEFTTIEFYESYSNLEGMMKRTEELILYIANILGKSVINFNNKVILLKVPFKRLEMTAAISKVVGQDMKKVSLEEAKEIAKKYKVKIEPYYKVGHIINGLFEKLIENTIDEPTFVYGHPIEISPLAAKSLTDPRFTERAELYIDGREYANMFTELNDPIDQYERFSSQIVEREAGNDEANELDMDFIEALEYGMPPAGGCGIGIDRLVMLFTGKTSIREVLLFPHLKNKQGQ